MPSSSSPQAAWRVRRQPGRAVACFEPYHDRAPVGIFMIAGQKDHGGGAGDPAKGLEQFPPLFVPVPVVHEITDKMPESGLRRSLIGGPENTGTFGFDFRLGVAEIDERKRCRPPAGRFEMVPFTPAAVIPDPVGIPGFRGQRPEDSRMVIHHRAIFPGNFLCPGSH